MQPYLFPYIGYFQLVDAVDTFVFFDDVNFITKGYIHRNAIGINGKASMFTVPLAGASQNLLINEVSIHEHEYAKWRHKFSKTLKQQYGSAPFFKEIFGILNEVFDTPSDSIASLAEKSVRAVSERMKLTTKFTRSSHIDYYKTGTAQEKVLDICAFLKADTYINPVGGMELYENEVFQKKGIDLFFMEFNGITYPQKSDLFVSSLSIIDVLMYNEPERIADFLREFELIKKTDNGQN